MSNRLIVRYFNRVLFGCVIVLLALQQAGAQRSPTLTLQIIPTTYSSQSSPIAAINFDYTNHFHVLLTNTSTAPINLFEEWNSFGYYGLSFEITYPDGRIVRVGKAIRGWDKNFPSTITIEPGGYYVFNVTFKPDQWENSPLLKRPTTRGIPCRMRAIYSIEADQYSRGEHAWTGKITTAERPYIIW
ncbi:hypothetical protein [Hymenobacter canadensis]|uniref:Uncharacterized protein n=1 Tax=Hymenobacter canadensis TaxID=2999067 RepID=A0ABY7LV34_9BACT|nr:hypothetical protein [Hymenobacter canadensis]WBA44241.1 hypothetical protein O3303_21435 [Hymenobacter canadensis]